MTPFPGQGETGAVPDTRFSTVPEGLSQRGAWLLLNTPTSSVSVGSSPTAAGRRFPPDFVWGAATSAYQVEGATHVGDRSPSIWDAFVHTPGRILGEATGDIACDHFHRLDDDLDLLSWLGARGYRFSISWPRWQPHGCGHPSPGGVAFYDRLVDGLLARGIQPWVTLYHWDLPQELQESGGWAERDTAYRFAEYANSVGQRLGDRVAAFLTLNEPWCSAFLGYAAGVHAPGVQDDVTAIRAAHHLLLAHGEAVAALRRHGGPARVGIALNLHPVQPSLPGDEDCEAVRRIDGLANRIFLDPLLRGSYPADVVADLSSVTDFAHVRDNDLKIIGAPLDLLGENYYRPYRVTAPGTPQAATAATWVQAEARHWGEAPDGWRPASPWVNARDIVFTHRDTPLTAMGWEVEPSGLTDLLLRLATDYDCPPLYVTENGAAFDDDPARTSADGTIQDAERTDYLAGHLTACHRAITEGVDLRGYFAWSLLDNFEWAWGYESRFGIVAVDYATQRRTPKASAHYLRHVIRNNALPL